jgi:hypothetical protein
VSEIEERGAADLYETAAPGWERGRLGSYRGALGLRWDGSAGYWIRRGESVGRRVIGVPSAGQRTESTLLSVFETIRPKSPDHCASPERVTSLETGFSFKTSVEESEQPASTSRHASFGERFLFELAGLTIGDGAVYAAGAAAQREVRFDQ